MFGIERLLVNLLGENSLLIMLAGFFLLILLNFFTKLLVEFRRKDLRWNDLPAFIQPLVLYTVFLVGLDILVTTGRGFPVVYELFQGLQIIGYVSVMAKYFKRFYDNLKLLGLPTDEAIDRAFNDKMDNVAQETKDDISSIVEEYMARKEKQTNETEAI
jgi:hypothetical protein